MTRISLALLAMVQQFPCAAYDFADPFTDPNLSGWQASPGVKWHVESGRLISPLASGVQGMLLAPFFARDLALTVDVRLPVTGRRNLGIPFRFRDEGTGYVVRWYDQKNWLELLRYEKGQVFRVQGNHWHASSPEGSAPQKPNEWYTLEVQAIGESLRARVWPLGTVPPPWQLVASLSDGAGGAVGLAVDETQAEFRNFFVRAGIDIASLLEETRNRERSERRRRMSLYMAEGVDFQYGICSAAFKVASPLPECPPELVFRAAGVDNYYFVRAVDENLVIGKVLKGEETLLAKSPGKWRISSGEYQLDVRITPAPHDQRGPAWFINTQHVPPMLCLEARISRAGIRPTDWMVRVVADPVIPGAQGEPYWQLDPFTHSSARNPLGTAVGWREGPGISWSNLCIKPLRVHPKPCATVRPIQRIETGDRGGCWLALGDLDNDGHLDYLVARNSKQCVTALTAYANNGHELWRWGQGGSADISYDVPANIYDIDLDGRAEVLCSVERYLLVLDGRTGAEKTRWPLPTDLAVADCLVIANLRGLHQPADILIKTRYDHLWAFTNEWQLLWEFVGNTGHHPDVADIDNDGRDEVLCGFSLIDHDGTVLWQKDLPGHADAARLVSMEPAGPLCALNTCCGGNDAVLTALSGEFIWRQRPKITDVHFQTAHVGEIRPRVAGYEILIDEGWAQPARVRLVMLSATGEWLGAFYVSYPRFHRLIDWDGDGVMEIAIPSDGVICTGEGEVIAKLEGGPTLGGPGTESPMAQAADVQGDGRDELILFNAAEIAVFANPAPPRRVIAPLPAIQKRYYNATYY
ncbi:MAG: rhamnogalacturonan lyase family protein [Candidatus Zipacnadales bacterium]